ncbi:uncharacterized protein [Lepeophtheirus salmonis]|uniref:uncharacterized protein n=1 Tax=Lepeophtheirus salmonis TaxID=72036 RepID=UPI001AE47FEB|nr:uncharacterized protein LOC121128967 [Lepeophtheirus salmonis]XP_040580523.1 uncharacterized protein LOC121128967 [Lepeophtheirus salmonis]XP_040580524.1 uncharacterized protein LOC121128967 [Lepeophtheirus salmonis]
MILQQQRISLKGSDERIDYFTELLKICKKSSELSGAGVILEATLLWKRSKCIRPSIISKKGSNQKDRSVSTRNCYLFVFTPPRDFDELYSKLNSLKTDKTIKQIIEGRTITRNEVLLEALIIVLENQIEIKERDKREEEKLLFNKTQELTRSIEPWTPVHDQAIKTKMNSQVLSDGPEYFNQSSIAKTTPLMTLKERKMYAQELQTYLYTHPPEDLTPPGCEDSLVINRKIIGVDCDEVYPRIILGNGATLKNIEYLKRIGITHVLNAAEFRGVNLNNTYFENSEITYKGLRVEDTPQTQICKHFSDVAKYINDALLQSSQNKVFVNCVFGKSRSTTCIVAYLMLIQGWTAMAALTHIRKKRDVLINYGFLNQIADLDYRMKWEASNPSY